MIVRGERRWLPPASEDEPNPPAGQVIKMVCEALMDRGYDPVNQLVGYLLSGDPTYVTNHQDARRLIQLVDRDELLLTLVRHYMASISEEHEG